uniref:Sulfate_transp domain-containing protein n=1 Tax=Caenorhabditis japonica TaxID=281687 RepID=A0A8R1HYW6_CAEJA
MYRRLRTESFVYSPDAEVSTQSLSPPQAHYPNQNKQILSPVPSERMRFDANMMQRFTKSRQTDVIDQSEFDRQYRFNRMYLSHTGRIAFFFKNKKKWRQKEWLQFMGGLFPIAMWLPKYAWKSDFIRDLFGGLMVSVMSLPQSLAYGMLVGVPANYGLITGIVGPLIYALFGTSRHASPGSFAIVSLMVGAVVVNFGDRPPGGMPPPPPPAAEFCCRENKTLVNEKEAVAIATSVTLLVGLFQILFGIMNAGLLAVWLSEQLVQGLISGAAVHVMTSQLKSMTGISNVPSTSEPFQHLKFYMCFFRQIHTIEIPAIIISILCVTMLLISSLVIDPRICKKVPLKFPMELILVVSTTLTVQFTRQTAWHFPINTVGRFKSGFPMPVLPPLKDPIGMMGSAISIAIISFVMHISLCRIVSKKYQYVVSSNQEWLALGTMHTTSSFFGCFAGGSSLGENRHQNPTIHHHLLMRAHHFCDGRFWPSGAFAKTRARLDCRCGDEGLVCADLHLLQTAKEEFCGLSWRRCRSSRLEQGRKKPKSSEGLMAMMPTREAPVAKSVDQKSAPIGLGDNAILSSTQSSATSLLTGVDSPKDHTAKEGGGGAGGGGGGVVQKRTNVQKRTASRSSVHWDDLDKTQ